MDSLSGVKLFPKLLVTSFCVMFTINIYEIDCIKTIDSVAATNIPLFIKQSFTSTDPFLPLARSNPVLFDLKKYISFN